jgi:hypothetical protein
MRNHYIIRYEKSGRAGTRTINVTMPVDSSTTAEDILKFLVAACAKDGDVPVADVRVITLSLVHQTT